MLNQAKVTVLGSPDYGSHLLQPEVEVAHGLKVEFEAELKRILDEIWETYERKGQLYDQASPVWHHFCFGLHSFATQTHLKATRFVSLLQSGEDVPLEEITDTLRDLTVYAWYAWAYANQRAREAKGG